MNLVARGVDPDQTKIFMVYTQVKFLNTYFPKQSQPVF